MPFDACVAFTQGYIGYHLQNAIGCELRNNKLDKKVVSLITQVEVNRKDKAFTNPTKPIGVFFTKQEADKLHRLHNQTFIEDSGRGFRRVIASPIPYDVVEKDSIVELLQGPKNSIVISCGGGGIPVVRDSDGRLRGRYRFYSSTVTKFCPMNFIISHFGFLGNFNYSLLYSFPNPLPLTPLIFCFH